MKRKKIDNITYRLFWFDEPVGFENWCPSTYYSYTYGVPEKRDGYNNYGWSKKSINHNRKEVVNIQYVKK